MLPMPTADALGRYLSLATQEMKATAQNMANISTPGYRTTGLDFEHEFQQSLEARGSMPEPVLAEVDGLVARPDGNNVSIDRESMQMAKTQLQFRTAIELLRHQYSQLMDAIRSDGK